VVSAKRDEFLDVLIESGVLDDEPKTESVEITLQLPDNNFTPEEIEEIVALVTGKSHVTIPDAAKLEIRRVLAA
jgi:hypothetical protein